MCSQNHLRPSVSGMSPVQNVRDVTGLYHLYPYPPPPSYPHPPIKMEMS